MKTIALFLLISPAFCAINGTMQWDVRTGGSDNNGGGFDPGVASPGTDWSVQDAAHQAYTDLVIGATTTQLTSAAHAFGSAHPGNTINITGGGGCTTGVYEVISVSGTTATMDRSVGTAASTCTGNLGGGFATPAKAWGLVVADNTVHIKSGSYSFTGAFTLTGVAQTTRGYGTAHNDYAGQPTITTSSNINGVGVNAGGKLWWDNIYLENTNGSSTHAGLFWNGAGGALYVTRSKIKGWGYAAILNNANNFGFSIPTIVVSTEITACGGASASAIEASSSLVVDQTYFHANTGSDIKIDQPAAGTIALVTNSVFTGTTQAQMLTANAGNGILIVRNSVFYGTSTNGISPNAPAGTVIYNSVFYGLTSKTGINMNSGAFEVLMETNAFGSNGTDQANVPFYNNKLALTADPFTNGSTGDFSPNSTSGGGPVLKSAAFPPTPAGQAGNTYEDVGAIRHQDPAGGSTCGGAVAMLLLFGIAGVAIQRRSRGY